MEADAIAMGALISQLDFEEKDGRHVSRLYDAKTGILVLEIWTLPHSQKRDRADGPAYSERHHETGIKVRNLKKALAESDEDSRLAAHEGYWLRG